VTAHALLMIKFAVRNGLFESSDVLESLLQWAGYQGPLDEFNYTAFRDAEINRLADTLEQSLDMELLLSLITPHEEDSGTDSRSDVVGVN